MTRGSFRATATAVTLPLWPFSFSTHVASSRVQRRTRQSDDPDKTRDSSLVHAVQEKSSIGTLTSLKHSPVLTSHTRVPSVPVESKRVPSEFQLTVDIPRRPWLPIPDARGP